MPQDPNAAFDSALLERIELSSAGGVPHTPAYQDALKRLQASHQVYADADHKDGYVSARSLTGRAVFHAGNLADFAAGRVDGTALETNLAIFDRYVRSLNSTQQSKAEGYRASVPGKPIHHRKHAGHAPVHDPVHTLFLVPGGGPHPGLPGNYLYGFLHEIPGVGGSAAWSIILHDSQDAVELFDAPTLTQAFEKLEEVLASAPFHLGELAELGFRSG